MRDNNTGKFVRKSETYVVDEIVGKTCSKCEKWKPYSEFYSDPRAYDGLHSECKECSNDTARSWQRRNPKNVQAASKRWQVKNPQAYKDAQKRWEVENAEYRLEYHAAWRDENREHINAYARQYRLAKPEVKQLSQARRRARKARVLCTLTLDEWQWLVGLTNHTCLCCFRSDVVMTVDHIVALDPGAHTLENVQPLCLNCNCKKQRKTIDYRPDWLKRLVEEYINANAR